MCGCTVCPTTHVTTFPTTSLILDLQCEKCVYVRLFQVGILSVCFSSCHEVCIYVPATRREGGQSQEHIERTLFGAMWERLESLERKSWRLCSHVQWFLIKFNAQTAGRTKFATTLEVAYELDPHIDRCHQTPRPPSHFYGLLSYENIFRENSELKWIYNIYNILFDSWRILQVTSKQ